MGMSAKNRVPKGVVTINPDKICLDIDTEEFPRSMCYLRENGTLWYVGASGSIIKCKDPVMVGVFMYYMHLESRKENLEEVLTLLYLYIKKLSSRIR